MTTHWFLAVLQVIWIDVLLSGDNAVVIALACQALPPAQRRTGIALGVGLAIIARLILATVVTTLLALPSLKLIGGLLLIYIAVKVIRGGDEGESKSRSAAGLWRAVGLVALADVVMSLDNVVAIAAVAQGHASVFAIGLLVSMPFTVIGASIISGFVVRYPAIIWVGGAFLGWIAGGMIQVDPIVISYLPNVGYAANLVGMILATGIGWVLIHQSAIRRRLRPAKATA